MILEVYPITKGLTKENKYLFKIYILIGQSTIIWNIVWKIYTTEFEEAMNTWRYAW